MYSDSACTQVPNVTWGNAHWSYFEITDTGTHNIPYQIYQYVQC
jgi:hypothetical protein